MNNISSITKVSTKRVEKYITQSLCVNYRGDYLAVASVDMMDFDTPYSISYHAGRFPAFEVEYFATIEELAVAMRKIADLRTWKINKYED